MNPFTDFQKHRALILADKNKTPLDKKLILGIMSVMEEHYRDVFREAVKKGIREAKARKQFKAKGRKWKKQ